MPIYRASFVERPIYRARVVRSYELPKGDTTEMSQAALRRTISHIGPLQIAIIVLAVVTGLIHLSLGIMTSFFAPHPPVNLHPPVHLAGGQPGPSPLRQLVFMALPQLFYLNFVGYVVLAIALYLPSLRRYQRVIRWILIVYVAITIVVWALINGAHPLPLAYIDKPIEVALIVLLLIEDRRVRLNKG